MRGIQIGEISKNPVIQQNFVYHSHTTWISDSEVLHDRSGPNVRLAVFPTQNTLIHYVSTGHSTENMDSRLVSS
jgi:hypothetical protein